MQGNCLWAIGTGRSYRCVGEVECRGIGKIPLDNRTRAFVGNEYIAFCIYCHASWTTQTAGHIVDRCVAAGRQNLKQLGATLVGDKNIAVSIHRDASGEKKTRGGKASGQGVDSGIAARRQYLIHRTVVFVADEDVIAYIYCYARGVAKTKAPT